MPALKRTLSLWQVSVAGIGVILGAGVYALIGPAAGFAGNAVWIAFLVAGVTGGLTAYTYARLGSLQPKASPEFQYTTLAFGPRVGFMAGWLMLVADTLAAAAVALGFGGYLAHVGMRTPVEARRRRSPTVAMKGTIRLHWISFWQCPCSLLAQNEPAGRGGGYWQSESSWPSIVRLHLPHSSTLSSAPRRAAAREILAEADAFDADLIAMTMRSGPNRLGCASVAEEVGRRALMAVVLVRAEHHMKK